MRLSAQFSLTTANHARRIVHIKKRIVIEQIRLELVKETRNTIYIYIPCRHHTIMYTSLSMHV